MPLVPVPPIRDLGVVPNNNMDESTFNSASESFTGNMSPWGADVKAVGDSARTNAEFALANASSASGSATDANQSASAAAGSAAAAAGSASAAAGSATSANAGNAALQEVWLGDSPSHPTVDKLGRPVKRGASYGNTTDKAWYWYDGANWQFGRGNPASVDWSDVRNKPATVAGYGITDAVTTSLFATYDPSDLMENAPVGRRVAYTSTSGTGADWPTSRAPVWWNVDTYGAGTRTVQRAEQVFNGAQKGWVFERFKHDTAWSRWYRVINDGSVIERLTVIAPVSGPITLDIADSSMQYLYITGNVPITIPPPRVGGEQLTVMLGLSSSGSFSFSSNVRAPLGAGPVISGGQIGTFALVAPTLSDNLWLLYRSERHSLT